MIMILIRGRLQGGDLTPVSCAQFQDHLRFINVTSGREAYARVFVRTFISLNRTYALLRNDLRTKLGWFLGNIL